jgi:hypothetical protein
VVIKLLISKERGMSEQLSVLTAVVGGFVLAIIWVGQMARPAPVQVRAKKSKR